MAKLADRNSCSPQLRCAGLAWLVAVCQLIDALAEDFDRSRHRRRTPTYFSTPIGKRAGARR
jgi:hypothetical protein